MQRLSKVTPGDFKTLTRAMKERFEPNCQIEIYWRKFQARLKQSDETWHDFADDLHGLVDKAIPDVQEEARQHLAVMRYLEQLSDTQVAFSVRQKRPKTLAEAVALTQEMESLAIASGVSPCKESPRLCMAGTQTTTDINAQGLLTTLLQRMGKLEDTLAEARMHMGSGKKRNDVQYRMDTHSTTPVLPINSPSAYKIPAFINNTCVNFLLDTGAAVSLIRRDVWEQVNAKKQ